MRIESSVLLVATAIVLGARASAAQRVQTFVLRVRVVDSANAPVAGADVAVIRGLQDRIASGVTDVRGIRLLTIPRSDDDYQVSVRKLGYARADQFLHASGADTATTDIVLRRAVQTLAPVLVTAEDDLRRRSYHIDADAIANSDRTLIDATDIITKLRPDIVDGRSGLCSLAEVWVNGQRVRDPTVNERLAVRAAMGAQMGKTVPHLKTPGVYARALNVMSVLSTIKPEHVEEMTYNDCLSKTVDTKAGSTDALFVVLKPGIAFEEGRGSYVLETSGRAYAAVASRKPADSLFTGVVMINGVKATPAQIEALSQREKAAIGAMQQRSVRDAEALRLPAYRLRLIGVFDSDTGEPLEGVELVDAVTGDMMRTTATGTATLAFLQEGAQKIRLRKAGFATDSLSLVISPRDTVPITAVLKRMK